MTPATKTARLIAYYRVSAVGDRGDDLRSVDEQRDAVEAIVKLTPGASIVAEVEALNASGGKSWPEPKLADIIERIDRGEADGIVIYALDRFGRALPALEVIERWAEEDKTFLSASDKFDAATPSGRMALRMMMVVARYYWEMTRDRFAVAQTNAIERGAAIGRAPLGYTRQDDGTLAIDPDAGPAVTEAFRVAVRDGLHAACDSLAQRFPTMRWRTSDARRVLSNRVYLGELAHGRNVNRGAHDPLTMPDVFAAAQTEPQAKRTSGRYLLSGIATCGRCGAPMVGALQTVKARTYRRYRCSAPGCRGGSSISAEALEGYMRDVLAAALADTTFRTRFVAGDVQGAREALARAEHDLGQYMTLADIGVDAAAFKAGALARQRAVDEARAHYRAVASQAAQAEELPAAGELDDPEQLLRALRAVPVRIAVRPGRGNVDDRVSVSVDDLDDGVGVAAA